MGFTDEGFFGVRKEGERGQRSVYGGCQLGVVVVLSSLAKWKRKGRLGVVSCEKRRGEDESGGCHGGDGWRENGVRGS